MVLKNQTTLVVIALLLGLLFVVSFQPLIVGNVVYNADGKIDLSSYPYPFIKNNYYNDVYIVIGKNHDANELFAANDIAAGLKGLRALPPPIVVEDNVPITAHNLILVGTPCSNSLVADYFGTSNCNSFDTKGIVSLDIKQRQATLVVSGKTSRDVRKAALFLKYYKLYMPMGKVALVDGPIENPNGLTINYQN